MTVSGGLFGFLIFGVLRVEQFFVFDGFGEPTRIGVMMTTVELVDGICRLVETVHGIGSEFLFFTRIEFVLYLTPVTVIEKVHPIEHESVSITLLGIKPVLQTSSDERSGGHGLINAVEI